MYFFEEGLAALLLLCLCYKLRMLLPLSVTAPRLATLNLCPFSITSKWNHKSVHYYYPMLSGPRPEQVKSDFHRNVILPNFHP